MKVFEVLFSFTPEDDSSGEGMVTVSAETAEAAKEAVQDFLGEAPDLVIQEIREIVELPDGVTFTPRTLQ